MKRNARPVGGSDAKLREGDTLGTDSSPVNHPGTHDRTATIIPREASYVADELPSQHNEFAPCAFRSWQCIGVSSLLQPTKRAHPR